MADGPIDVVVKRRLRDLLAARVDGPDTTVLYWWESGRATTREAIWFDNSDVEVESSTPTATGHARHPRLETLYVDVVVQVADGGADPDRADEVEERVCELYTELDDLLAGNKLLSTDVTSPDSRAATGVDGLLEAVVVWRRPEPIRPFDKGFVVRWVARVKCVSNLN